MAIHSVQAGNKNNPAILFIHGYPQNWRAFEKVMGFLEDQIRDFLNVVS
jgi:hypothetical protein